MLFSDLAVVKIDNFHDVAVQVKTNKIIVSLIHAKTKEDIIPTLASSLQECLTVTIVGISKFYSKLSEGVPSQNEKSAVPFNIEFGVFCESDMCFFNHNEMSMSTGLGRLEMERCPLPHHVRRLTAQLSIDECREIAIMLGSKLQEWDDLVYEFERQPANDLKFISLWSCIMKSVNFSFGSLQMILEKKGRSAHLLCELFRDVKIDVSEELLKMYNEKCDRVLMPKEKLNIIISRFNILCESETIKRTRDDYNLLSRYEVLQIAGLEKLIRKRKTEEDPILYFVSLEETFDVIKKSHSALNHAGRDKMQKELNKKYANKNRRNHSGIKRSPYEAMFGCPPKGIQRERHASGSNLSKQAEKMVARSNQILRPVQVGDNVTVPIPSVDRGRGDPRNLLCIVLEHDQTNDQFKLGSKDGILNGSYSRNQFTFSPIHSLALQDANTLVELSVREAARQQSIGDGQGFLKCAYMSEDTLNKIPSVDALHELSNHIGNINMQLAIELEVDVSFIQQIQYNHKNKLIDQTRIFF
ncbi:unnamed protein product [Mytilus edulis]|uniref:Uncharacterized protein n=1 Tax=Mytilus edulis TaxID=6550 RepID=A0A8S3U8C9_MYTED|nr:unnamed protein product [Mytilus edulis]